MDFNYSPPSCKRSGQIPAFGDWDYSNQLPITQYFESARQAGLIRFSSSSVDSDPYTRDLYAVDSNSKAIGREKRCPPRVRQGKKVCDATEPPWKKDCERLNGDVSPRHPRRQRLTVKPPKPVDEDLYKIPPELLRRRTSKRKKMLGMFSRCLVPVCSA